jgi:glycosyltransferase involved in cell wall biosynthesis
MRLAIVSSFDDECGPAFYTARLKHHLEAAGHDVDVLRLPVTLLRHAGPGALVRFADREIDRIAHAASSYDGVLLQFEPGLFGAHGWLRYKRAMRIIRAAKKVVLTVHGFDRITPRPDLIGVVRQLAEGTFSLPRYAAAHYHAMTGFRTRWFWRTLGRMRNVSILTFCIADRFMFERLYGIDQVHDFPLVYYSREEVSHLRATHTRHEVLTRYGLDPAKRYIAVAGFFGRYKGFLTAIKALEFLPDDYQLAIVGGEHPQAIAADADIGGYLREILGFALHERIRPGDGDAPHGASTTTASASVSRAEALEAELFRRTELRFFLPRKPLAHRVHFLGQVSDEEMPPLYLSLDVFVHPYIKTQAGQSASGPATLALEFGTTALFSNVSVFREMHRYFRGGMRFFNIGNFMELAQAIERYDRRAGPLRDRLDAAQQQFQPRDLVAKYEALLTAMPSA